MPEIPLPENPLIVLKFGGSVLLDEQRLRIAVHEIYRWRRDGWRVLAVVSALSGRTDQLVERGAALSTGASDQVRAALIASGELESAALLGIHLDRAGVPARVLSPASVRFVAAGPALDADPVSIDPGHIERALEIEGVAVLPGFVAVNRDGQTVTLGRGGSDLTAIYLAGALDARRCRLVKDVDGLYESDPARSDLRPRRFGQASYDDALATDGSIIQHKAVRYAREHGIEFELGRFNGVRPTRIGSEPGRFDDRADSPIPLSLALCGLGTVGGGVARLAAQLPEAFSLVGGACRTPEKHDDLRSILPRISADPVGLARAGADVVVEAIGGTGIARRVIESAIEHGSHVVSANKALLARHGSALRARAERQGVDIRCSSSVGGGAPVLEAIGQDGPAPIASIRGVLNGTGNFVLGALERGAALDEAVGEAQRRGFAEADPSRDLDGRDSLDKLLVIAGELGWTIDESRIRRTSIGEWVAGDGAYPARHIASLTPDSACVRVQEVGADPDWAGIENEWNAVEITYEDGSTRLVRGKGAGRWPTSESVLADLLELSRARAWASADRGVACV